MSIINVILDFLRRLFGMEDETKFVIEEDKHIDFSLEEIENDSNESDPDGELEYPPEADDEA